MTFIRSGGPGGLLSMLGQVIPSSIFQPYSAMETSGEPVGQLPSKATSAGEHVTGGGKGLCPSEAVT